MSTKNTKPLIEIFFMSEKGFTRNIRLNTPTHKSAQPLAPELKTCIVQPFNVKRRGCVLRARLAYGVEGRG